MNKPTLPSQATLLQKYIPCFLCDEILLIRYAKKQGKPYYHCNSCGIQCFIRGKEGILRLDLLQMSIAPSMKALRLAGLIQKLEDQIQSLEGLFPFLTSDDSPEIKTLRDQRDALKSQLRSLPLPFSEADP